jgi:hypothetical protein
MELAREQIENHRMTAGWTSMHAEGFSQEKLPQQGLRRGETIRTATTPRWRTNGWQKAGTFGSLAGSAWAKSERGNALGSGIARWAIPGGSRRTGTGWSALAQ